MLSIMYIKTLARHFGGGLAHFPLDVAAQTAGADGPQKSLQLGRLRGGDEADRTVRLVLDPTAQREALGDTPNRGPEAHALDPALVADEEGAFRQGLT
jgi:hypothetical protein